MSLHDKWTKSIAVGSKEFLERVKIKLGALVKGRKTTEAEVGYQLKELSTPYHILIVDDDQRMAKTLKDILNAKGYEADAVYSGSDLLFPPIA